jgi:hypothetical protein
VQHVLEGAGGELRAAAHHRLQCFGPARKIHNLEREPFRFEIAQLFRHGQREVIEKILAAHRQRHRRLLGRSRRGGAGTQQ